MIARRCAYGSIASAILLLFVAAGCSAPTGTEEPFTVELVPPPVATGDSATFTLLVTNTSSDELFLDTLNPGSAAVDVVVRSHPDGPVVWWRFRPSGLPLIGPAGYLQLNPGETRAIGVAWDLRGDSGERVAPGTYSVTASLRLISRDVVEAGTEILVVE